MVLRRKRPLATLAERHAAFEDVLSEVERAKDALTEAVPGSRMPGRPLAEAMLTFEDGLRSAEGAMDRWRAPEVELEWFGAFQGLHASLALAERLRTQGPEPVGFEALIGSIGGLLAPLDAFGGAIARFRSLRT
ncbi:MAG: hypothetical protein L0206_02375 [Actinobacteria bacterium]|nr:hypothetical protein [Actinomycetota bacterium]